MSNKAHGAVALAELQLLHILWSCVPPRLPVSLNHLAGLLFLCCINASQTLAPICWSHTCRNLSCPCVAPCAGANFSLQLRSPCLSDMVDGVLAAESSYEHWGLLHRLQRVLELLDNAEAAGGSRTPGMACLTVLQLFVIKLQTHQQPGFGVLSSCWC